MPWFEEYTCGCVSEIVSNKDNLLGYCGKHGNDRRKIHPCAAADAKKPQNHFQGMTGVRLVQVYVKVGTLPGLQYFIRKRDLKKLVVGGHIELFKERYANPEPVILEEMRQTGGGPLWIAYRF